ncbi:MAG: hypothetical protein EBU62_09000, partial [Proteobacteria bacterium]|nr:hypothetical protein [Pseudomonadota bacterium]
MKPSRGSASTSRAGLRLLLTWEAGDAGADGTVPWGNKMFLDADGLRGAGHCNWQIKEAGRMVKHPASLFYLPIAMTSTTQT